jgi:hypothetical protein
MLDTQDGYQTFAVVNFVDDAIVPYADTSLVFPATQFDSTRWAWCFLQRQQSFVDAASYLVIELTTLTFSPRAQQNLVTHQGKSPVSRSALRSGMDFPGSARASSASR